jgi:hypothetical protein
VNTRITYQYRDAANHKQRESVVFAGAITQSERTALVAHLDAGMWFVPSQVGLADLQARFGRLTTDDHAWHELDVEDDAIELTEAAPTHGTIHEFVGRCCATNWDEVGTARRLGIPE